MRIVRTDCVLAAGAGTVAWACAVNWGARGASHAAYRSDMTAPAHRGPAPWTVAGWNRRAAHRLWDSRLGHAAAEELAAVRLPAYRALAAFLVLVVAATLALVVAPFALPVAVALVGIAVVLVALGVRPLRRAGTAVRDVLASEGVGPRRSAPLNDGRRFDAWLRRNGLDERLRSVDLAALLRTVR